ncbi:BamA/TamA family outer membrane protein [Variovorax sp. J22R133]|uniref:autotransporter assembly complex protein TamA n=1 Tax=Variovorax brevis TaxID=3053503 RepID=UPI002575B753|nr:BamA/TamA family outer membrane protein [Variovorax sp. J22R133]MDM0114982.1 BamA/TamA family outer membrane protein [Variovorax sp. J22R133]
MLKGVPLRMPACWPALFFSCALLLQGCSLLPKKDPAEASTTTAAPVAGPERTDARDAFTLEVNTPDKKISDYLKTHLEMQRYRKLDDLGAGELSRLMVAAEANARELLNTLGYFGPTITLELHETPEGKQAAREVVITVEPGEPTRVNSAIIDFTGPIETDEASRAHRDAIRADWKLPPGQIFTQEGWDNAKSVGLRSLAAKRFPTASVTGSKADIDADANIAKLSVGYESGPAYRFGPLVVRGNERYDADATRRIARVPTGTDYDQQKLLDAQQRLASSGYYDSVFLTLDTSNGIDPQNAPVLATVRESPYQKVVLGLGYTSDSGPRVSVDHIDNKMPLLGWRAVSKFSYDKNTHLLSTEWSDLPDDSGWRLFNSAKIQRDNNAGSYTVDSAQARTGRAQAGDHIDRSVFLQYDYSVSKGIDPPPSAAALSLNWGWTGRYFDNTVMPTKGNGLALELGAGYTLLGERLPYLRAYGRWLGIVPLGSADSAESAARRSRFALRAELGAVTAKDQAQIPQPQLFLTGGDTTVRGYAYRQIGVVTPQNQIVAGRYLGVASIEWQRPVVYDGKLTDFESVVFVDSGGVADKPSALRLQIGTGVGVRWKSPVGPVQADIAYGVDVKSFRLHLRLGFTF